MERGALITGGAPITEGGAPIIEGGPPRGTSPGAEGNGPAMERGALITGGALIGGGPLIIGDTGPPITEEDPPETGDGPITGGGMGIVPERGMTEEPTEGIVDDAPAGAGGVRPAVASDASTVDATVGAFGGRTEPEMS